MKISLLLVVSTFLARWLPPAPNLYLFTQQINDSIVADTSSYATQQAAWWYSFVGEYERALWAFDQDGGGYPSLSEEQKNYFLSFRPTNARDFILQRAKDEKIVMINEAHHQPMHRVFTTSLLQGLYDQGYRYLGLETFAHEDTLLNERGYPLLVSGYYTQEPQFGNLVREALRIGYELFPYETQIFADGKEREIQQARYIQQMVEAHPEGKFLIHCGFDHINEAEGLTGWEKAMASRVKEYTGIDPFTINQEILTERYQPERENPFFKLVDTLSEASVFINQAGDLFRGAPGDERFDVRLFHPRTTYTGGRPAWLLMPGQRKIYTINPDTIRLAYPVMIKAYPVGESREAVPVDIVEWQNYSDQKALVLPPGEYALRMLNLAGDTLEIMAGVPDH